LLTTLRSPFELHKKRLACIRDLRGSGEIRKISVAALESALKVAYDLFPMDEEARATDARIFDEWMMPITVIILMQRVASTATLLEAEYHLDTGSTFQLAVRSLKAASRRWMISGLNLIAKLHATANIK
jgi:hypothetical protein